MSILINMEMPKDGAKLYMIVFSDGKACASYKPFEWHEVVSLPPHGRLIDADALLKKCEFACTDDDVDVRVVRYSVIEAAPTIIPASGGNEGEEHTMDEFMYGQEGNPNDGSM